MLKGLLGYAVLSLILAFSITGTTLSKYVATSGGGESARVASFGGLLITESNGKTYIYAPGADIEKDPKVSFKCSELSAYVFVQVSAPDWSFDAESCSYSINGDMLFWSVDTDSWSYLGYDSEKDISVYYRLLNAGEDMIEIPVIENSIISVSESITNSELDSVAVSTRAITFKAYAIQAGGFGSAADAWRRVGNR